MTGPSDDATINTANAACVPDVIDDHTEKTRSTEEPEIKQEKKKWWRGLGGKSKSESNINNVKKSKQQPEQVLVVPNVRGKKNFAFRNPRDSLKVAYRKEKKKKDKVVKENAGWSKLSLTK